MASPAAEVTGTVEEFALRVGEGIECQAMNEKEDHRDADRQAW